MGVLLRRLRLIVSIFATVLLFQGEAGARSQTVPNAALVGTWSVVRPDVRLTPGRMDTINPADIAKRYTTNCPKDHATCTYSEAHRNVPESEKNAVYAEYEALSPGITTYCHAPGFTTGKNERCEVDHLCPVGGGGSNATSNLWIERADATYNGQPMGFHQKDALEAWAIAQEKAGMLSPAIMCQRMSRNWVQWYLEVNPQRVSTNVD